MSRVLVPLRSTRRSIVAWVVLAAATGCYASHRHERPEDAARPVDGGARDGFVCRPPFASCTSDFECCGGACSATGGICAVDGECGHGACCSDGVACVVDVECCSGLCSAGVCSSECRPELDPCTRHIECCNGECSTSGICLRGPHCGFEGEPCATDVDCCALECHDGICQAVTCEHYLGGASVEICSDSFSTCMRPVSGVPCCTRVVYCDAGRVADDIHCDDSCDQRCGRIDDAGDCTAFGCAWVVPEGCFDEIDPAWVNGCVRSVGATCAGDLDCPSGERCRPFAIDPCAGLPCDACFAEERRCVAD